MMGADSDQMKFLYIPDTEQKKQFLESHPGLASESVGKWYIMLAETRIKMFLDYPSAIRWANCAVAIGNAIGDRSLEAGALCVVGEALLKLREGDQANQTFRQAKMIGDTNNAIQSRAKAGIEAAERLPTKKSLASEKGPLSQLLEIIDDKIGASRFVGQHPYLKQTSIVTYCLQAAETNTTAKEWDKVVQYAEAAQIIAGAMGDYTNSIKAGCLCGDALIEIGDEASAASAYLGVITDSFSLKDNTLEDVKTSVEHAKQMYSRHGD